MANYTTSGKTFVNPYNFVSLEKECYKIIEYQKKKEVGNLTGWIECSLETLTPVFIPNTTNSDVFKKQTDDGKPIKSYDFYSYTNLEGIKKPEESTPVIPGSEIRGMIRSAFETVTNSCLSIIDDEQKLYKRVTSPARAGQLVFQDNEWKIIECRRYGLLNRGIRKNGKIVIDGKEYKEKDSVSVKIKNFKAEISNKGTKQGFLHIGEYNENKKYESVFIPTDKEIFIDKESVKNLIDNFKLYQDESVNLHLRKNEHTGYRHITKNAHKLELEDMNGILVYCAKHGEKYYLSPAAIGREVFYKKLTEIIGSFKPCDNLKQLCQACALFGLAGKKEAAASRVRFTDALSEKYEYDEPQTLKELASPKLSATEFYLKRPEQAPDLWNYDYAGRWVRKDKRITNKWNDMNMYAPEIRGRKFYWHQKNPNSFLKNGDNLSERNVHVRPLKKEAVFNFRVYFNDISEEELNKLLWVLEIGGKEENAHKIGMGKPIGMGSVKIRANSVNIRKIQTENGIVKYKMQEYEKPAYADIETKPVNAGILEDFLKITNFQKASGNVTYPCNEGSDKVYEWFVANKQIGRRTGTSPVIHQTLPEIVNPFMKSYVDIDKKKTEDFAMNIKRIQIKNFKVFKDTCIESIGKMNVFLGVNGSGKSTLFDVFGFLSDALQNNMTVAVNRRGGFSEVMTRGCNPEKDFVSIEIEFSHTDSESFTYSIQIGQSSGKAIVKYEVLSWLQAKDSSVTKILDFSDGRGTAIEDETNLKPISYNTASPDILAIKGLGQFERFKSVSSFRLLLEKWYISNFRIEYGRNISDTGISAHLSASGDNLAQVTKFIYENHPDIFESILEKLPMRIPGISNVEARETEDGRIVLRFQDKNFKDPFISRYVSDGTIKMFAYMILLYDPEPHPLLCIEEPENFLHPDLLPELCEEIRAYADRGGQIFVSTHSPDFVNGVRIDELYYLEKKNGYTQIKAVRDNEIVRSLAEENKLGWLWRNRYIQGASLK